MYTDRYRQPGWCLMPVIAQVALLLAAIVAAAGTIRVVAYLAVHV